MTDIARLPDLHRAFVSVATSNVGRADFNRLALGLTGRGSMKRHGDEFICWMHDVAKRLCDLGLILVPDVTEFNGQLADSAVSQPMLYVPRLAL